MSPPAYTTLATVPSTSTPAITSPPATAYPAVLVGRPTSSLSEIKPKVPPPVPPRGTPKTGRSIIQTNGKGANLLYTNGNLLHDLLCLSVSGSVYSSSDDSSEFNQECTKRLRNLKRYDNTSDLNVDLLAGRIRRSKHKRSVSLREKYLDETCEKYGCQTLPRCKKEKSLRKYKFSWPVDEYAKKPQSLQKETIQTEKTDEEIKTKQKYGAKVKALKNMFDKRKDDNGKKHKRYEIEESEPTYRKPRYNPNFIGTSSYLERKKKDSIPRIIVTTPSTSYDTENPLSPQKQLCEVYNSKQTRKCFDLGDLV